MQGKSTDGRPTRSDGAKPLFDREEVLAYARIVAGALAERKDAPDARRKKRSRAVRNVRPRVAAASGE